MGAPSVSYQVGGTAGASISGTVWVIYRHVSASQYPYSPSSYSLEVYNTVNFPNLGVDTPVASFNVSNALPFQELSVFAHTTQGQMSAVESGTFNKTLNPSAAGPIQPMVEVQNTNSDSVRVGVVYLGTDDIRETDQ